MRSLFIALLAALLVIAPASALARPTAGGTARAPRKGWLQRVARLPARLVPRLVRGKARVRRAPRATRARTHANKGGKSTAKARAKGKARSKARAKAKGQAKPKASARAKPQPKAKGKPKTKRGSRRLRRIRAFLAGLFIDGPKATWGAIKKNPKGFLIGLGVMVGAATLADVALPALSLPILGKTLTLTAHDGLVAVSAGLAAVETIPHIRDIRRARSKVERARKLGRTLWAPALVVASALGGAAVGGEGHAAHSSTGSAAAALRGLVARTGGHVVTTADAPTILVTAREDRKFRRRWREIYRKARSSLADLGARLRGKAH